MPTFEELRNRYVNERNFRIPVAGSAETVERDSRADLSPKEFVEQKLRLLADSPPRFAPIPKFALKPR